jgi:hypothetical protein
MITVEVEAESLLRLQAEAAQLRAENKWLREANKSLNEALKAVNHQLVVNGRIDHDTPLHDRIDDLIAKAADKPTPLLDIAWERINALGGKVTEYDDFGRGSNHAVEQALDIIDELKKEADQPVPRAAFV